jgi:hypothetical protein
VKDILSPYNGVCKVGLSGPAVLCGRSNDGSQGENCQKLLLQQRIERRREGSQALMANSTGFPAIAPPGKFPVHLEAIGGVDVARCLGEDHGEASVAEVCNRDEGLVEQGNHQ